MFYPANLDPQNTAWVNKVQESLTALENAQPRLDSSLAIAHRESQSVMDDVSSRVNAYYTNTLAQYPVFQYSVPLRNVFGNSTTVAVSAPASANQTVAENWVDFFTANIPLPVARTNVGVRLNGAQFTMAGPTGYAIKFRWWATSTEGINNNQWMSRHNFFLTPYTLFPAGAEYSINNRYAYRTGGSITTLQVKLQGCIESLSNRSASVASQNVTLTPVDNNGNDTYLDVMVTA